MKPPRLADGLGWPEGPALLRDGRVICVETYRSRISVWAPGREVEPDCSAGPLKTSVRQSRRRIAHGGRQAEQRPEFLAVIALGRLMLCPEALHRRTLEPF